MVGWVKIHRALAKHDLWLAEPFTYGQAWVDLVINTNHAPGSFMVKRQRVSLERGQIGWSEITMTERWKWSRGKVRRFLKRLSSDGMIEQQAGHLTSIITVCNYDSYQSREEERGTSDSTTGGTRDGHLTVHEAVHKQECKELKNEKKQDITPYQAVLDSYHENLPMLPRVQKLTDARKRHIKARWSEVVKQGKDVSYFDRFFVHVAGAEDFLLSSSWCNLEWLMKEANFVKVIEGNYHNG
jgi:hypothetical protein